MEKKEKWKRIKWDGNPDLNYECYRKKFGRGHVSVGIGDFLLVCYSYGANSDSSMSGTRWRKDGIRTEQNAMKIVDRNNGKHGQSL